jgi:hypothetical protein
MSRPTIYDSPEVKASCKAIHKAAAEHHYPLVINDSQLEMLRIVIAFVIGESDDAIFQEPKDRAEILRGVAICNDILAGLNQAKVARAGHGGLNDEWRGSML